MSWNRYPMSAAPSVPSPTARNAAIHAAEPTFRSRAADIVILVLRRAEGGAPVCLGLVLGRAPPAGRIAPAVPLPRDYAPGNLKPVLGAIGKVLGESRIHVRQASRLLDALGAPVRLRPGVANVRKFA